VQDNFKRQLFDESRMVFSKKTKTWNLESCVGNQLLKEIDPYLSESRDYIRQKMKHLIHKYYEFRGYLELANIIKVLIQTPERGDKIRIIENRIHNVFDNRLIIIDEVHNIRSQNDQNTMTLLTYVARVAVNMRLILLSATPIYNSPKEIVSLANLMLTNDNRPALSPNIIKDGELTKSGREKMIKKLMGYISFVRGENPYSFPFRVYPMQIPEKSAYSILQKTYPTMQMHGEPRQSSPIQYTDILITPLSKYQESAYEQLLERGLETAMSNSVELQDDVSEITIVGEKKWGYNQLQVLLQSLDIVFPGQENTVHLGADGLKQVMDYNEKVKNIKFTYHPQAPHIFEKGQIRNYSCKIDAILNTIENAKGTVIIFAEYIWGGIVPLALALEERGYQRYSTDSSPRANLLTPPGRKKGMTYTMITGVDNLSPDNANDVKDISSEMNKYGELIKVVLISTAGSEGLDFKFIRQIHIMDPWYTMSRIEQIIGRGVRNGSHCALPQEERNVEIYMYAAFHETTDKETADLYLYRYAEQKAIQIGKMNRLLKEISVDCILNEGQQQLTVENMNQILNIELSSGSTIEYKVGDKPYTTICDFMDNCDYQCYGKRELVPNDNTYSAFYLRFNRNKWMDKIRELFKGGIFATTIQTIIQKLNAPKEEVEYALQTLSEEPLEFTYDNFGREGRLLIRDKYIVFQPLEMMNERASMYERKTLIKHYASHIPLNTAATAAAAAAATLQQPQEPSNNIIDYIDNSLKVIQESDEEVEVNEDDLWTQNAVFAVDFIEKNIAIGESEIQHAIITHYIDEASLNDKLILIQNADRLEWKKDILRYVSERTLHGKWLLLFDRDAKEIAVMYKENNAWIKSTMASLLAEIPPAKLNEIKNAWKPLRFQTHPIGFMGTFNNTIVFKAISEAKSKGVNIFNGYSSPKVLAMTQTYLEMVYNIKDLELNGLPIKSVVILLEILMRNRGHCDSPEKVYVKW
jgi:hypothetical protein